MGKKVDPVMWDIELSCRWNTLHARDRILERLNPDAATALRAFVDSCKQGMSFTVLNKAGLERFRLPE